MKAWGFQTWGFEISEKLLPIGLWIFCSSYPPRQTNDYRLKLLSNDHGMKTAQLVKIECNFCSRILVQSKSHLSCTRACFKNSCPDTYITCACLPYETICIDKSVPDLLSRKLRFSYTKSCFQISLLQLFNIGWCELP